ncbi:hypothetical protein ON010_g16926 [Phytophthora cinnamomi]|nr:hypothetical protein ON010_g16926 [Phytophthora cinnamomi]
MSAFKTVKPPVTEARSQTQKSWRSGQEDHQKGPAESPSTHRSEHDEEHVADADGEHAGEAGERVVGHRVDLPAALGVHPVEHLDLGGICPLVVVLHQFRRHLRYCWLSRETVNEAQAEKLAAGPTLPLPKQ